MEQRGGFPYPEAFRVDGESADEHTIAFLGLGVPAVIDRKEARFIGKGELP